MDDIYKAITEFCAEQHGSTNYSKDTVFVRGEGLDEFAPLSYVIKKVESVTAHHDLITLGFTYGSWDIIESTEFATWFEHQFGKKIKASQRRDSAIIYFPDKKSIFDALQGVHSAYEVLRNHNIILNGKNLPVQLGEWFAKCIFGLQQEKSTSQRGFDFKLNGQRVEVKVHWADQTSPKGIKLKKSMVKLSDTAIIIYLAKNFMIRDICLLDTSFIERKFQGKGHTVFLKDPDLAPYFFSKSSKHFDKVVNKNALMRFSSPTFALKLDGRL